MQQLLEVFCFSLRKIITYSRVIISDFRTRNHHNENKPLQKRNVKNVFICRNHYAWDDEEFLAWIQRFALNFKTNKYTNSIQSLIKISWKLCLQYSFVTFDSTDNDFNFTDSRACCRRITLSPFRSIFVANDEVIIRPHARIEPCNSNLKLAILAGS